MPTQNLEPGRQRESSKSKPYSVSSFNTSHIPPWQHAIRRLLKDLPRSLLDNNQLVDLHINLQEDDELSVRPTLGTSKKINAFCTTDTYKESVLCLPQNYRTRPELARVCSKHVASLLTCWAQELGQQYSETRAIFDRKERTLHITSDSRTKGVKIVFNASDISSGHSIAVIIPNRQRREWQLSSTELYALLALADEQRKIWPRTDVHKVHVMMIHSHWAQRLSANISSRYLASIIFGEVEVVEQVDIHRTPWFNFMEESGRQGILQAIFEFFPLSTKCTVPPLPPFPSPKRKFAHVLGTAEEKGQKPKLRRGTLCHTKSRSRGARGGGQLTVGRRETRTDDG